MRRQPPGSRFLCAFVCGQLRRRHLLVGIALLGAVSGVYLLLFHLADSLITSLRRSDRYALGRPMPVRRMETSLVVAHYIGTGNLFGNLSDELLNGNMFDPHADQGADGRPVAIPPRESLRMQQLFAINRYNLLASDRIPLNRTLRDQRKEICKTIEYDSHALPNTTVIIVFHNEAWSVLLRTVWSVINRTPAALLHSILLVDDASTRAFLKRPLSAYCRTLPVPVRVLRLAKRNGLVRARLLGARSARGQTLTFLDAHCECSVGWLPPLLDRIRRSRSTIACPVIDIISDDNFAYVRSFELHTGAFNWQLQFRWYVQSQRALLQQRNASELGIVGAFPTPAMAGGLFTIDREYFHEIGSYDDGMLIWGGENLEMSWRVWQCGGRIEIVPCSHVGHLFRKSTPYTFPGGLGDVLTANLVRAADVWMDDWAAFFYRYQGIGAEVLGAQNVSERRALRERLRCKSFDWYLRNVWPEHFFPADDRLFGKLLLVDRERDVFGQFEHELVDYDFDERGAEADAKYMIDYLNGRTKRLGELFAADGDSMSGGAFCAQGPDLQAATGAAGAADRLPFGQARLRRCRPLPKNNATVDRPQEMREMFVWTADGRIMTNEGICLDSLDTERVYGASMEEERAATTTTKSRVIVRMVTCSGTDRQRWQWIARTQQLRPVFDRKRCLTASGQAHRERLFKALRASSDGDGEGDDSVFDLHLTRCDRDDPLQKWIVLPLPWR